MIRKPLIALSAAGGGWGYGQFENGKPKPGESIVNSCFACHARLRPADDFVFTTFSR